MGLDWVIAGGLIRGIMAGTAARTGRLCTIAAIEDALIGSSGRAAKAWGLALVVAIASVGAGETSGLIETGGAMLGSILSVLSHRRRRASPSWGGDSSGERTGAGSMICGAGKQTLLGGPSRQNW